ncbi:MAG: hypothetical protein ACE5Q6_08730 [Dehalococcoidia bacterium]
MECSDTPFAPDDDVTFVRFVTEHLAKGAATRRGITDAEYARLARERWKSCQTDQVYAIKLLVDPLVQPELASELPDEWTNSGEPFCELIARIDSNGELPDAPPGYVPPSNPGVLLAHIPAGSPSGGIVPDPQQPVDYLIAFLDVLGFEALLKRVGLEELNRRYEELLTTALAPHSESRPWSLSLALVQGQPTPALMWLPIQTAYFSDSLLLWVHYHPAHVPEFLDRCSRVFCQGLALGLPIRGAISVGRAILDKNRGIFLGLPLVEAVRLESKSNWIGVALAASWKSETLGIPVPPDRVFMYEPPFKDGGDSLFSGLVLDWPRVWRESRRDSAVEYLLDLCTPGLPEELRARYSTTIAFYEHSHRNQDWFLPPEASRVTPRDLTSQ